MLKLNSGSFVTKPLVSILLPTFNCANYLAQAIESILKQSYSNIELLIGNDGSTDNSVEIIDRYLDDSRIKFFNFEKNIGKVQVFNFLLDKCTGEYVTAQDADDWSHIDRIKTQLNFMMKNQDYVGCGCQVMKVREDGRKLYSLNFPTSYHEVQNRILTMKHIFTPATILFKAEILKSYGGYRNFFEGICGEDEDLVLRVLSDGHRMTNIPQVLYYYRYHPFSLSHNFQLNFKTYYSFAFARELYRQRLSVGSDWIESNDVKAVEDYFHKAVNSEPQWESNYIRDVAKKAILAKEFQRAYLLVLQTFKDRPFSKANLSIFMVFVGTRLSPVHPLRIKRRLLMKNGGFSSNPRLNNFVSLFSGLVTSQVLNFFLYVILARLFTEEQFGAFSLFTSYVILVSVISNPQIPILALSSKNLDQLESIEKWSESNLIASFFVMIPFFLFFFFLNKSILGGYLLLIPFAVFLYTLTENRKIFYNQREDFRKSNVLTLVPRTSGNLLKIFLSGMSGVANGLIIGEVLGNTFTLFVRLPRLWHRLPNLLNEFKNHKSFLIYNYPSTLAGIATMELVPFFIISLFSVEVAGAYFLFDKFVLQPFVLTGSAIGSSQARYISSLNAESKKLFFAKVFSLLFFISVLAVLFLRNFGDEIIFFLAKKTLFADNVLQILMFFVPLKLLKGVIYIFHHASSNWRWGFVTRILQVSLLSGLFIYGKLNEISIENFVMGLLIIELIGELLIIISSLKSNISSNADSRCSNG